MLFLGKNVAPLEASGHPIVDRHRHDTETTPLTGPIGATRGVTKKDLARARRYLYVSHFFAQFADNSWQFALVLFLAAFTNYESLVLVSTYGLVNGISVCMFGATAGRFVDGSNRLFAAQSFIWTENLCVLVATLLCYNLLGRGDGIHHESTTWIQQRLKGVPLDPLSCVLLIGIHVFGPLAMILAKGFLVAIERDWVVIMSHEAAEGNEVGPNKAWLSETNVTMKQIDLSCKMAAPAVAGFVVELFDAKGGAQHYGNNLTGAALLVGVFNIAALIVEYICTARIYDMIPALAIKVAPTRSENRQQQSFSEASLMRSRQGSLSPGGLPERKQDCGAWRLPEGLQIYLDQPISWAGFALSLLYLNVLTFGGLMTAYLVWRGMRLESVGIWRGISSAAGLGGTFAFRFSSQRLTVVSTGMWSICFQFACITLSFGSFFVDDFRTSMAMLIVGVCASRVGLWVFDISVTLMQEFIPDGVRGVVGGTQEALNAFFSILSFGLGLFFPDPREFYIYVFAGYIAAGLAVVVYSYGTFLRGQEFLLPSEKTR